MCLRVLRDALVSQVESPAVAGRALLTDVTRLNFFEVLVRGTKYEVARAGLVH